MEWSYGVTTVPSRFDNLLPQTLKSLEHGGFPCPHIFIDDCEHAPSSLANYHVTCHYPRLRTPAHWHLSAFHLYLLNPDADRYALFQDDLVTYHNLRSFLEAMRYPPKAYLNLYTFPTNEHGKGWHQSNQRGLGAVALVFDNDAMTKLLLSSHMVNRHKLPTDPTDRKDPKKCSRRYHSVDGGIVEAFKAVGYREWVHSPTLTQHTGIDSSMGNKRHPQAVSFKGENFDCMRLL